MTGVPTRTGSFRTPRSDSGRERTDYNSGGHHESLGSSWLPFVLSGSLREYERLEAESRWHIARNPGWAYRGNVLDADTSVDRPTTLDTRLLRWDGLAGFGPKDFYLWRDAADPTASRGGETY